MAFPEGAFRGPLGLLEAFGGTLEGLLEAFGGLSWLLEAFGGPLGAS